MFNLHNFKFMLIFLVVLQLEFVQNKRFIKLISIECKSLQPHIANHTECKKEEVKNKIVEVTIGVKLYKKPVTDANVLVTFMRHGIKGRIPMLLQKINCCDFLENRRRYFVGNYFYNMMGLAKYSNMNHSCPYNHDILLHRYPFDGRNIRSAPAGSGEFDLILKWYSSNVSLIAIKIHIDIQDI